MGHASVKSRKNTSPSQSINISILALRSFIRYFPITFPSSNSSRLLLLFLLSISRVQREILDHTKSRKNMSPSGRINISTIPALRSFILLFSYNFFSSSIFLRNLLRLLFFLSSFFFRHRDILTSQRSLPFDLSFRYFPITFFLLHFSPKSNSSRLLLLFFLSISQREILGHTKPRKNATY